MAKIKTVEEICQIKDMGDFAHEVEKFYKREVRNKVLTAEELIDKLSYILINHVVKDNNWIVMIYLNDLLKENEYNKKQPLCSEFEKYIDEIDGNESYFAIYGYGYLMKKEAYEKLLSIVFGDYPLELRALSIKLISYISNQTFDRGLHKDVAYWSEKDLRLSEIEEWKNNGCLDGEGYKPPIQDEALKDPKTKLEKAVAKLQIKLEKLRSDNPSEQDEYLVVADKEKLDAVLKKYPLNGMYLEFLTRFSPQKVSMFKFCSCLTLYGVDDILDYQLGYSVDDNGNLLEGWPDGYLVIADGDSDPYCINLNEKDGGVYFARHGEGEWKFEKVYNSLSTFLTNLAR